MVVVLSPSWNEILEGMIVPLCARFPSGVLSDPVSDPDSAPEGSCLSWY